MNRMRAARSAFRRGRRSQATPLVGPRRRGPGPQARTWLGWLAAAAGVAVVAFLVGRAGSEVGIATPTPSPSAAPLSIRFGMALDQVTGEAIQPTDRFRAGDQFAYSVRLAAAPGTDTILVQIIRLEGQTETVAQVPSKQGIVATSPLIAFKVPASRLLDAWGAGSYAMRMFLAGATRPFATGSFTLIETPVPS